MVSTSIYNFNADNANLNKFYRVIDLFFYLISNWINNLFPYANVDKNLVIRNFIYKDFRKYWDNLPKEFSPPRRLSDFFWLTLPWNKIYQELGEINVLDIGCGSGSYGQKLLNFSDNKINSYTGIDIYQNENWGTFKQYANFQFYEYDGKNISDIISPSINFILSQSTLEHVEEDLDLFKQMRDYVLFHKKRLIQVHLFPSRSCLLTYPGHGIRQYTPRTISKITRMFKDSSYSILFGLGGKECNRLHFNYITKPRIKNFLIGNHLRKKTDDRYDKAEEYNKKLIMAIEKDMEHFQKLPAFYALVIHSNWNKKIF